MLRQPRSCSMSGCGFSRPPSKAGDQNAQHTTLRAFPRDPLTCASWIKASGNPTLVNYSPLKLSKSHYLCDSHFNPKDGAGRKYLQKGAIPTKLSHTKPLSDDILLPFLKECGLDPHGPCLNLPVAVVTPKSKESPCLGESEQLKIILLLPEYYLLCVMQVYSYLGNLISSILWEDIC